MPGIKVSAAPIEDEYEIQHRWIFFGPEAVITIQRPQFDHNKSLLQINDREWIVDLETTKLGALIGRATGGAAVT